MLAMVASNSSQPQARYRHSTSTRISRQPVDLQNSQAVQLKLLTMTSDGEQWHNDGEEQWFRWYTAVNDDE